MSPLDKPTGSLYCIPAMSAEKERLKTQYAFKKKVYDQAVPSSVLRNLDKYTDILDIAAGTCVWTLDLANLPQIKPRLRAPAGDLPKVNLYACDINTGFFPEKSVTDRFGITTFQQDATKPFHPSLHGKFDLVHVSYLAICLTRSGWDSALENYYQLLKPGGTLFLDELDTIFYREKDVPALDAHGHNIELCMAGDDWVSKTNCVYTGFSLHRGFLADLTFRLPSMLEASGFHVVDIVRGLAPAGKSCRSTRGIAGASLDEYEDFTIQCMALIFEHQSALMLQEGVLEAPRGNRITTKAGMRQLLSEINEGFEREGAVVISRYFVAQKC